MISLTESGTRYFVWETKQKAQSPTGGSDVPTSVLPARHILSNCPQSHAFDSYPLFRSLGREPERTGPGTRKDYAYPSEIAGGMGCR
jgi:hypothetical protein